MRIGVRRRRGARGAAAVPARAAPARRRRAVGGDGRPQRARPVELDAAARRACASACASSSRARTRRSPAQTSRSPAPTARGRRPRCCCARSAQAPSRWRRSLAVYEEVLAEGERGLLFAADDADTMGAQLRRLIEDAPLRERCATLPRRCARSFGGRTSPTGSRPSTRASCPRRHPVERRRRGRQAAGPARPLIDVDLHMHTDHSHDCATPVEVLLATARDQGLGAIAVTDHNVVSGAHEARRRPSEFGVKVIVAEEVKTAHQGEVIGLFIDEQIPRGLTLAETVAEIKRQGGLVYVPHPFDRMHAVPDYEHLLTIIEDIDLMEVYNPRVAIGSFNEEAERFAAKYRIVARRGLGLARRRRASARSAFGCATSTGPRSSSNRCARPRSSRSRRRCCTSRRSSSSRRRPRRRRRAGPAGPAGCAARRARADARRGQRRSGRRISGRPMPQTDDEIREKYLERAIRELNALTRELQACSHCPRGNLMPVLGSGHPQADVFLLKFAPMRERGRGGRRLLRPRRHRAHEVLQAAGDRPARRLRDAVREVPGRGRLAGRPGLRRARGRGARDRAAARSSW